MQSSTGIWRWASSSIRSASWAAVNPWPIRSDAQVQRSPDRFRRACLTSVRGQTQTLVGGVGVNAAEQFRRCLHARRRQCRLQRHGGPVSHRQFENFLRFLDSEVAGCVEDPEQRHSEIASATGTSALQTLKDRGEILLAKKTDANRDIDLGVQHVLFFQALHEPVRDEFVVVGSAKMSADSFKCHQETLKIGVAVKRLNLGQRGSIAVEFAEFEQGSGLDRPLEVQVQLRLGELADEGIRWASRYGSHLLDCSFSTQDLRESGRSSTRRFSGTIRCSHIRFRESV